MIWGAFFSLCEKLNWPIITLYQYGWFLSIPFIIRIPILFCLSLYPKSLIQSSKILLHVSFVKANDKMGGNWCTGLAKNNTPFHPQTFHNGIFIIDDVFISALLIFLKSTPSGSSSLLIFSASIGKIISSLSSILVIFDFSERFIFISSKSHIIDEKQNTVIKWYLLLSLYNPIRARLK